MPDIRVQDEQGTIHVFPDGSTPDMIAKALNVRPPAASKPQEEGWGSAFAHALGFPTSREEAEQMMPKSVGDVGKMVLNKLQQTTPDAIAANTLTSMGREAVRGAPFVMRTVNPLAAPLLGQEDPMSGVHALSAVNPFAAPVVDQMTQLREAGKNRQADATGVIGAASLALPFAKSALKPVGAVVKPLMPRTVSIAGVDVPVAAGEAAPATRAGRLQTGLKAQGVGQAQWERFTSEQQMAVKQVIRNVAQQTSDLTGPMPEEASGAVKSASDAVHAQARPMYQALDASASSVPDTLSDMNQIVSKGLRRAQALGKQFNLEGAEGEADFQKAVEQYKLSDESAQQLRSKMGLNEQAGQPFTSYQALRSQLLKMMRSATDPAMRNVISDEVGKLNDQMESTLEKSPELLKNWQEANRLWTKGYALRTVSEALDKATKGTPSGVQQGMEGVEAQAPQLRGSRMVSELNTLDRKGVLNKAFTPEQVKSLRQVANLLDRSQTTGIGKGTLRHAYSQHSLIWRSLQYITGRPFVTMMTATPNAPLLGRLLSRMIEAKTPAEVDTAGVEMRDAAGAPPVTLEGKVTPQHVQQENAYYTQARSELGANASPSQVLQRAQQIKMQARVQPPAPPASQPARSALSGGDRQAAIASVMMSLKHGDISQQQADSRIQRLNGGGGRKLVRMPPAP